MYVVIISFLGMELAKTRRTGNRARKNNVFLLLLRFRSSETHICMSQILQNFRARIWLNSRFVVFFGHFSLDQFDRRILNAFCCFQSRRFCVELFFAGAEYVDSHIAIAGIHIQEKIFALWTPPNPWCIHRSNNTRDLYSIATYNVRSTRNVNMAAPLRVYTVATTPELNQPTCTPRLDWKLVGLNSSIQMRTDAYMMEWLHMFLELCLNSFIRVFFKIRRHVCSPSRLTVHTPFPDSVSHDILQTLLKNQLLPRLSFVMFRCLGLRLMPRRPCSGCKIRQIHIHSHEKQVIALQLAQVEKPSEQCLNYMQNCKL